jgi:EpsI family protein
MKLIKHSRFVVATGLLIVTLGFLHARSDEEVPPSRQPLASFPRTLGTRTGIDYNIPKDVLDVLGNGDFLLRIYPDTAGSPDVDLFVAYFPSQRAGDTLHSPKNCLPGAGWFPVHAGEQLVRSPAASPFIANEYLIAKDSERKLVLYWYQAHHRTVASEYWAKFYLVADALRMNRSDGSLIRITTPVVPGEQVETARGRLLEFAGQIVPVLERYIPQ